MATTKVSDKEGVGDLVDEIFVEADRIAGDATPDPDCLNRQFTFLDFLHLVDIPLWKIIYYTREYNTGELKKESVFTIRKYINDNIDSPVILIKLFRWSITPSDYSFWHDLSDLWFDIYHGVNRG